MICMIASRYCDSIFIWRKKMKSKDLREVVMRMIDDGVRRLRLRNAVVQRTAKNQVEDLEFCEQKVLYKK